MFETVRDRVFPFIKSLGQTGISDEGSTYTYHMKDALFMMPTPRVLANVVDQLDDIDMTDRDTKGDLYEYMLGKIATADFDTTMLRIGSMNMLLHGVERTEPGIAARSSSS